MPLSDINFKNTHSNVSLLLMEDILKTEKILDLKQDGDLHFLIMN